MRPDNRVSKAHAKIRSRAITIEALTPSYAMILADWKASEARQEPPREATTARIAQDDLKLVI